MKASKESQTAFKSNNKSKQSGFYNSLSRSKQNKVAGMLKELKNLKTPKALDTVKNQLLNESERMDRLLDLKDYKKDPNNSM